MEAQELRIGNYAMGNKPFAVDANHIAMAYNHEIAQNGHERFKSIPLTEDWLIRLGFEKTSDNEHTKDRFVIRKQQRDLVINGFEYDYNGILLSHPEYVHTLQNLYFALMGEELTLKN